MLDTMYEAILASIGRSNMTKRHTKSNMSCNMGSDAQCDSNALADKCCESLNQHASGVAMYWPPVGPYKKFLISAEYRMSDTSAPRLTSCCDNRKCRNLR